MFCPKCGTKNENTNFCAACGAQLPVRKDAAPVAAKSNESVAHKPMTAPNQAPAFPNQPAVNQNRPPINPNPPISPKKPFLKQNQMFQNLKPTAPATPSKPIFTKENIIEWSLRFALIALYTCISLLFILSFGMKKQIFISSAFNESFKASITLDAFLDLLIKGNNLFNPTILSTSLGVLTNILFWSVPVFAVLAFISSFSKKGKMTFNTISAVISSLSALFLALIVPICVNFVPDFKMALSAKIGILAEDITSVTCTTLIIHAVTVIVFVAATIVISSILNKRREQK